MSRHPSSSLTGTAPSESEHGAASPGGRAATHWRRATTLMLDWLAPCRCPHCDTDMTHASFLCADCRSRIAPVADASVALSSARLGVSVLALGAYDSPLGSVVRALKYKGRVDLVAPLASALSERLQASLGSLVGSVCVPVPAHPRRVRGRGYNQASLLARAVSRELGATFDPDWVLRSRDTHPQPGLTAKQRHTNVSGAFTAQRKARHGQVLLFDDVFSTGATAGACLEALASSPIARVVIVVVARALS